MSITTAIITGLSGAGKSTATKALEDIGFYTIDNIPVRVIEQLGPILFAGDTSVTRLAFVIDVRSKDLESALHAIKSLKAERGAKVIFLTASKETLLKRYQENRHVHPLGGELVEAIERENLLLEDIKAVSDVVVDTSALNVHELTKEVAELFDRDDGRMALSICSFGFKYGIPADSDMVFDVRFLKNPHFVPELRPKNGLDADVAAYALDNDTADSFFEKLMGILPFVIEKNKKGGKRYMKISVGCTGGKHRSVASAEKVVKLLKRSLVTDIRVIHRDIDK